MKTVRERVVDYHKEQEEVSEIKEKRKQAMLAYVEDLPATTNREILAIRGEVEFGSRKLVNTACDGCGAALSKSVPTVGRSSGYGPSYFPASCTGCGWSGDLPEYCLEDWEEEES